MDRINIMDKQEFTIQEVREMLNLSRTTLWLWRKYGRLPAIRHINRRVTYRREVVLDFLREQGFELPDEKRPENT